MHANPDGPGVEAGWFSEVLARTWASYHAPREDEPGWVRAWSVGGVQGGETLVQSRPVVRDPRADFVTDFLRATSQATLSAYHAQGPDAGDVPVPRLGLARFQRWIGVRAEAELDPGEDNTHRSRLREGLPDFLVRSLGHAGDRELTVFGFLAALHAGGDLQKPFVAPPQVRRALATLDAQLGRPARINLFVSDGRTVGVLHRGGRLLLVDGPAAARSVRALAHVPSRSQASVLLYDPDAGEFAGDDVRRLPEGIYTLNVRQPCHLEQG